MMLICASVSTSFMNRTQRVQRMQRLRLSISVGPKSTSALTPSPSNTRRGKLHPALVRAEAVGEILERTLAALVAHRAVERVIDQQELEHAGARVDDVRASAVHDDHAFGDRRRARRLQLRHLLDLDDADAARAVDAEARVIAVVGNPDAGLDGRLEDGPALFGRDGLPVDRQRNGVHKPINSYIDFGGRWRARFAQPGAAVLRASEPLDRGALRRLSPSRYMRSLAKPPATLTPAGRPVWTRFESVRGSG